MVHTNYQSFTESLAIIVHIVNPAVISTEVNGGCKLQSDFRKAVVGEARYSSLQNSTKHVSMRSEVNKTKKN